MGKPTEKHGKQGFKAYTLATIVLLATILFGADWALVWRNASAERGTGDAHHAAQSKFLEQGLYNITCAARDRVFEGCSVHRGTHCARVVIDDFISEDEAASLIRLAETAFNMISNGGAGPVSVFDTASGATSRERGFIDVFAVAKRIRSDIEKLEAELSTFPPANNPDTTAAYETKQNKLTALKSRLFRPEDVRVKLEVEARFKSVAERIFGISSTHLTKPSFIARIKSDIPALQTNDEYWYRHVDTDQYGTFEHTAVLYLNSQEGNYKGGEFEFLDERPQEGHKGELLVVPKRGRMLLFTSGSENPHRVRKVQSISTTQGGVRYAWVLALTCDETSRVPQGQVQRLLDSAYPPLPHSL